ncbi:helix-turn-helix transcriptional regulator [Mesorhizobium sp. L-8-3]|uniref:helix-turn-helix transcriptional regulator n=1 Tax=Mesorhizobium sp. L-8-3 TaxID=2744522 RepID=UPI00192559BF|nr:YafY family protein [Mesorhizobium sp. L-8-3]BCH25264.1 DeoR family transcriptional regulator [Mesorhizobium sp. L-8-3]
MRLFRLFQLLDELRIRRVPVPARMLAQDMGVSLRTLYRDIADLQAMGAPIRGEGGVGYVMDAGYFMPSLRFDEEELSALALGVRLVAARTDPLMSEAARRAAAKIASAVGEETRRVFLDSPFEAGPSDAANPPHLEALRDAIRRRKVLEIDYASLSGKPSTRRALPLGLTVFDTVWLLTVWCETARDFRHLRVDRIGALRDIGERFRHERGKRFADCLAREGNDTFLRPPWNLASQA